MFSCHGLFLIVIFRQVTADHGLDLGLWDVFFVDKDRFFFVFGLDLKTVRGKISPQIQYGLGLGFETIGRESFTKVQLD